MGEADQMIMASELKSARFGPIRFSYQDIGDGPPVLLVHCSSASHREWSFLANDLAIDHRIIAPDLIGYGKSDPWPAGKTMPFDTDAKVIESLLTETDQSVELIGHSYGAAMCLEVARRASERGSDIVRSMTLIEPVSFHLLRHPAHRKAWKIIDRVASGCIRHVDAGRTAKAADVYMGFWLGALKWRFAPKRFKQSVIKSVRKVADEFRGVYHHEAKVDDYRSITCPVTLAKGSRTRLPAMAVVDVLSQTLPNVATIDIRGAGHMSPFTHQDAIRDLCLSSTAAAPN